MKYDDTEEHHLTRQENHAILADCTEKSRSPPRNHIPSKSSDNQGRRIVAGGRKIKRPMPPPPSPPPWTDLPRDITANILRRLGAVEILGTAQTVCTTWRSVCKDPSMWRVIDMREHSNLVGMAYDLENLRRHAVDRSQGQLVDIDLDYASDELLDYIATRSGKLRRLRLAYCRTINSAGLIQAIKRFPELEELHIIHFFVSHEAVEMVGHSCPLLRSFTYNVGRCISIGDDIARAIARSMPGLRHLQLIVNSLTNEGLEAILDGCPHLETLDLRTCYNVNLKGDLGKRLSAQIKCLRYPEDSMSDYESRVDDSEFFDGISCYTDDGISFYTDDDYDRDFEDDYVDDDYDFENFPVWYEYDDFWLNVKQ